MSRTSLTRTWEINNSVCSTSLAYHNTMHKCIEHYWDFTDNYAMIRYKRYEPAEIPF